jgi:hypothetical protein
MPATRASIRNEFAASDASKIFFISPVISNLKSALVQAMDRCPWITLNNAERIDNPMPDYPNLLLANAAPAPSACSFATAMSRRSGAMLELRR